MDNKQMTHEVAEVFVRLWRMHRHEKSPIDGMKHSEIKTLIRIKELSDENGVKVSDISNSLRVAPPTVTQVINTLEENGLIRRELDIEDRRSFRLILTEEGVAICKKAFSFYNEKFSRLVEALGEEKCKVLIDLLEESMEYLKD